MNELQATLEAKRADMVRRHEMVTAQLREQQTAIAGAVAAIDEMLRELAAGNDAPQADATEVHAG